MIDEVLGRNLTYKQIQQIFQADTNSILTSPKSISDEFRKYFENVQQDSISKFNVISSDFNSIKFKKYIYGADRNYSSSCFFEPISSAEILFEIKQLDNKVSKGFDGIDNIIVKKCSWYLVDILKYLYNLSLDSGEFPDDLKIAVVIPIFKKGDELVPSNYRPISLLSTLSKILEKLAKRRLISYLDKTKFLNVNQFGFTAGKSTEEALLHFLSEIYKHINDSRKPIALFVDIAKAFDTVDHGILLLKLAKIGIRGNILEWFASYIKNRRQVIKIGETTSCEGLISCGVPQGSVLGPLLFLIYFNSIFEIELLGYATAFADDLALSYGTNNVVETTSMLENDLSNLSKWFYHHRLTISVKSKVMLFGKNNTNSSEYPVKYHAHPCDTNNCLPQCFTLEYVNEFRYLGLIVDAQLNWKSHLNNTRKSVLGAVHKFYNLKKLCPISTLRKLYHALVESIIMYGISSWGGTYFSNIESLYIAQKRIIKLIYHLPKTTPSIPMFRKLNLLPLRYLYIYKVLKMFFIRSDSFHNRVTRVYNTRNPIYHYADFRCNCEKFRRFYLYMAPYFFHILPKDIKILTIEQKHKFERDVRSWLLSIDNVESFIF